MMNIDATAAMTWVVGFAWAFIALQWFDILRQMASLKPDVIPADLNLGERDAVKKHIDILVGTSLVARRARALLAGWVQGWLPSEVVGLSASQSARDANRLRAAGLFMLLVLAACVTQSEQASVAWIGIAALGATIFAKGLVLNRVDSFLEDNLLTRLPAHLPGTAMTAAELATQLGNAINEAFKNNVPQPDKMAAAVNASVENFRKASLESLESLQKKLGDSQAAMIDKWTAHEKQTSTNLEGAKKALESLAASFSSGQSTGVEKLQAALASHVQQLEKVTTASNAQAQGSMSTHAEQLKKAFESLASTLSSGQAAGAEKLQAALAAHVQQLEKITSAANAQAQGSLATHGDQFTKASQAIATQLEKIMALEKDIQKVLHLQQLVDGTMKSVSAAEEFKQTLSTLRTHIEASDKLLKELSKPRTIRLVETETQPKPAAPAAPAQKR